MPWVHDCHTNAFGRWGRSFHTAWWRRFPLPHQSLTTLSPTSPSQASPPPIQLSSRALHLGILMENMRREGFEFAVGPPKVITRTDPATGARLEPVEEAIVEVAADHVGGVVDLMAGRRAVMLGMAAGSAGTTRITYRLPTRGLLGLRSAMLTATKGTAVLSTILSGYEPWAGDISTRENGSLTAHETGQVTAYAVESVQQRGRLFARPGDAVYEDQVVGIHQRAGDLKVNVCRKKALTNMRASGKDNTAVLTETIPVTLDYALEVRLV